MDVARTEKIVSAVEDGWSVIAVAVPTRALRITKDDLSLKFRVEQLDPTVWKWQTKSTHVGDIAWESYLPALKDMVTKQVRLKEKIKLAQHEARMAMIAAQNPTGKTSL